MDKNLKISIAIPTYPMDGERFFMRRLLDSIKSQSYKKFEVIVADNSESDTIKDICSEYPTLKIKYAKSDKVGMGANTNEAIKRCVGDVVKILYEDDYFAHEHALKRIVDAYRGGWLATGCIHDNEIDLFNPHLAIYSENIRTGNNTIGSPSVVAFDNDEPLLFDENLVWVLDCDLYHRLHERYGLPTILNDYSIAIGIGTHQSTNIMGEQAKLKDYDNIKEKYD